MDIKDLILSDEALDVIDNGTWVGDFYEAPGLRLLVTGLSAKASQDLLEQKHAKLRLTNRGKPLSNAQLIRATKEVLAEVVLKDWDGLKDGGKPVPYSKELASKWIMSRTGEKFTALVLQAAQRVDAQASDFAEEVEKN